MSTLFTGIPRNAVPRFAVGLVYGAGALTIWAAAARCPAALPQVAATTPFRLLVVTGGHDYPTSFYTLFEGYDDIEWSHATSNHEALKSPLRDKFDVLVLYDMSTEITEAEKKSLVEFLRSSRGLVVLHHAILDYPDWEWWWREVVGGKYLSKPEGGMPASTYLHDQDMLVEPADRHPILEGIKQFRILDETYKGMWISPRITALLRTNNPTSDPVVAWVSPFEKSRVVYIQLGHGEAAHKNRAYRRLVHNAILWSAEQPGKQRK
ncbi:MAG: ThuA domain-containing protein [Terriglobia bacterium]